MNVAYKIQLVKDDDGFLIIPTSFLVFASQTNIHFFSVALLIDINVVTAPAGIRGSTMMTIVNILKIKCW